ncbi:MAG: hypothetical protein ACT4O1_16445 [Gemmatimonadota bacterium]
MSPRKKTRKLSAAKQRELQVIAAVAREAVLQLHVARALKLIDLAGNRVSVIRMLAIYTRVHALSEADAEVLGNKVLAAVGHRTRKGRQPLVYLEGEDENIGDTRTFVGVVRDRLKGRVLHELRRWVELHAGSTQAALIDLHVRHALRFVKDLNDSHGIIEALTVYRELVGVPSNTADALYIYTLNSLAAEELPRAQTQPPTVEDPAQVPLFPPQRRRSKRAVS